MGKTPNMKTKKSPHRGDFQKGNQLHKLRKSTPGIKSQALDQVIPRKIDKALVDSYLVLNSHLTPTQLIKKLRLGEVSVLEGMLIKGMLKAYRTGDPYNINFFLDRLIGRVPVHIAKDLENELSKLSDEELIAKKIESTKALRGYVNESLERYPTLKKKVEDYEHTRYITDDGGEATAKEIIDTEAKRTGDKPDKN